MRIDFYFESNDYLYASNAHKNIILDLRVRHKR